MLIVVGIDYHKVHIDDREHFSVSEEDLPELYKRFTEFFNHASESSLTSFSDIPSTLTPHQVKTSKKLEQQELQLVCISTCNRLEIYFNADKEQVASFIDWLMEIFLPTTGTKQNQQNVVLAHREAIREKFYYYFAGGAERHLFSVAAGLHSMVLGENQILNQLKRAYQIAMELTNLSPYFHKLFQTAIAVGKRVRSETDISRGGMSLGSVTVDLIKKLYERDSEFKVGLIGAGEIAEEVLKSLAHHGKVEVEVCNRNPERAQKLIDSYQSYASHFKARYIPFEERYVMAANADVVVVSTNASEYVLTNPDLVQVIGDTCRFGFFIDLSVPRNIDPKIEEINDLVVYTLDDLDRVIEESYSRRNDQVSQCEKIIEAELHKFGEWQNKRAVYGFKDQLHEHWKKFVKNQNHKQQVPLEKVEEFFYEVRGLLEEKFSATPTLELENYFKTEFQKMLNQEQEGRSLNLEDSSNHSE